MYTSGSLSSSTLHYCDQLRVQVHVTRDVSSQDLIVSGASSSQSGNSFSYIVDLSSRSVSHLRSLDLDCQSTIDVRESLPQTIPLSYFTATMVVYRESDVLTPVMTIPYGLG